MVYSTGICANVRMSGLTPEVTPSVNQHIRKLPGHTAPQAGSNNSATVRKDSYPFQGRLNFRQKAAAKAALFHFVPVKRIIEFVPGRLKEADIHGLYFSKTSAAETEPISPDL